MKARAMHVPRGFIEFDLSYKSELGSGKNRVLYCAYASRTTFDGQKACRSNLRIGHSARENARRFA